MARNGRPAGRHAGGPLRFPLLQQREGNARNGGWEEFFFQITAFLLREGGRVSLLPLNAGVGP